MLVLPITIAAIVLVVFVAPVLLAQRHSARAQETFVSSGVVVPKVIQNSTIVYGIGLATVAPLFAWGVGGEFWPALVYVGFVGLGLFLIYVLRRPWLEFLAGALGQDRSVTVHEFIARRHGNDAARRGGGADGVRDCRLPRLHNARHGRGAQAAPFGQ